MRWSATSTVVLVHVGFAAATLRLPDLQPVSGFSDTCLSAYNAPITDCPSASDFINPSGPPCTKACYLALIGAGASIQNACQYQAANSGTVIGQAFAGNLGYWLCNGENTGTGNAASSLTASIVITSGPTASSTSIMSRSGIHSSVTSAITTTTTSSYTSSTQTRSSSSSSSPSSTSTTLPSSTASAATHSSSTSSQSSTSHSHTTSSSTSHSSSKSTSTAAKPSSTIYDSTPFDQSLPMANHATKAISSSIMNLTLLGCLFSLGLLRLLSGI